MHAPFDDTTPRHILTPSSLNRLVRDLLGDALPQVWIEGELSNVAKPASGHLYFTLKDAGAQVRAAMFKPKSSWLRFKPADGMHVLVRARVGLYEPRGEYQLVVEHMEDAGLGALKRQFEELSAKLSLEGLFAADRKRSLPRLPKRIGIITSPTGAAVRDILHVLARRFPAAAVLIYPVPVQGAQAAGGIVAALTLAGRRAECDVLILARGGGSLEDLWAFNDERLARAIVASPIPVITGIGHEIDFTIADFAADVRAPTPSAAAELVVPDAEEWLNALSRFAARLQRSLRQQLEEHRERLRWLSGRAALVSPAARLNAQAQRLDEVLYNLAETCRILAVLVWPFLPGTAAKINAQLGLQGEPDKLSAAVWGGLNTGHQIGDPAACSRAKTFNSSTGVPPVRFYFMWGGSVTAIDDFARAETPSY